MSEFLVHMQFRFPQSLWDDPTRMQALYTREGKRAAELAQAGLLKRVWRIPGRTAHISLWEAADATALHEALMSWPMWGYMHDIEVTPLAAKHNDPSGMAEDLPGIKFTYDHLRPLLDEHHAHGEGQGLDLGAGISIHDHPDTDRGLQIHVMVDGQKVAEIGPPAQPEYGAEESVVPGYIDFLGEWEGRPVRHERWVQRIKADNGLLHASYAEAVQASRYRRRPIRGQ